MGRSSKRIPIQFKGIAYGVTVSMISAIVLTALSAFLIISSRVGEQQEEIIIYIAIGISVLAGAISTAGFTSKNCIAVLLCGCINWVLLVCLGLLFFDGGVINPWLPLLITGVMCGLVCATCMKKTRKKGYKKLRTR